MFCLQIFSSSLSSSTHHDTNHAGQFTHTIWCAAKASLEVLEVVLCFLLPFLVMMYCHYQVGKTLSQTRTTEMREIWRWKASQHCHQNREAAVEMVLKPQTSTNSNKCLESDIQVPLLSSRDGANQGLKKEVWVNYGWMKIN